MPEPLVEGGIYHPELKIMYRGMVHFTAEQMESYAAAKVREALEEAEEAVTTLYESEELPLLPDIAKAINAYMTRGK